uniref:CCHC-type domain-containing protein n=1 Tax=Strongyloides papillosus TaxID=174720 RepID=A0A0N5CCT0_STREA
MTKIETFMDPERGTIYECITISKKIVKQKLRDNSNYHTWSLNMIMALKCMKLWPINDSDCDATEKTLLMLRSSVSEPICKTLSYYTKAAPAWAMLKTTFEKNGLMTIIDIKRKLSNIQMKESEDLISYINRFRNLKNELSLLNKNIEDDEAVVMLLQGLPKKYNNIIVYLSEYSHLNFEVAVSELIKLHNCSSNFIKNPKSTERSVVKDNKNQKKILTCHTCSKIGHVSRNCPNRNQMRGRVTTNVNVYVKDNREFRGNRKNNEDNCRIM